MSNVFFLVLRELRTPFVLLISIYALAIFGLTLIPGVDADGNPTPPLSIFHAFYFVSYMATTIGFGEIPNPFSEAQRLWVMGMIYVTVFGWTYTIITTIALFQDKGFQAALTTARFTGAVRRIHEPFFLVCGLGETGRIVCDTLDRLGKRAVVLDTDEMRVRELELDSYRSFVPALAADMRQPSVLLRAGLTHPHCQAILALTNADQTNLAISMSARLLAPTVPVLARADNPQTLSSLQAFGTNRIISAFEEFAESLALAVHAPHTFELVERLTGVPGSKPPPRLTPPRGPWIVCGYGRFGHAVVQHLKHEGVDLTVIDPTPDDHPGCRLVEGYGTDPATLKEAGIDRAVGMVVGTDDDTANLAIAMSARGLNGRLFLAVRQNLTSNAVLFDAFRAELTLVPNRVVAEECLAVLTTPLLSRFLDTARRRDDGWAGEVIGKLRPLTGDALPDVWSIVIEPETATAARYAVDEGREVTISSLMRDPTQRDRMLPVVPLVLERSGELTLMPAPAIELRPHDEVLFAGSLASRPLQELTVAFDHVLEYVLTGREPPQGLVWDWLQRRRARRGTA